MSGFEAPLLETSRLLLTWPSFEQIEGYYQAVAGSSIFDTIVWNGPASPQELHDWWDENRTHDPSDPSKPFRVSVIERESRRYVGGVGLRPIHGDPSQLIVAYAFAVGSQGKGYATEAVRVMVDEAFAHRGAERIEGPVFVGNHASARVLQKLHFVQQATRQRALQKQDTWVDLWVFDLSRSDWERRAKLTASECR